MKVSVFPRAETDIVHQFRYYLVEEKAPNIAVRFREAVISSVSQLALHPRIGVLVHGSVPGLRSWPVQEFEMIRLYYRFKEDCIEVVRVLHGKRNVRRILGQERRALRLVPEPD